MAATTEQTKLDYFMDVLLRNYCRTMEENEILFEEMVELKGAMSILFHENSNLRHILSQHGIEAPAPEFLSAEDLAEIETLEKL